MAVQQGRHEAPRIPSLGRPPVPAGLAIAAAWCWRILVVSATLLGLVLLFHRLYLVVLPVAFSLLLAALLHPLVLLLRRLGLPRPLATWGTLIITFLVLAAIGFFVVQRASSDYQQLVNQVDDVAGEVRHYVQKIPGTNQLQLQNLQNRLLTAFKSHTNAVASGLLTAGTVLGEALTGMIVTFFVTFFFLDEGDRMFSWVVRLFPAQVQPSVRGAGYRAWHVLSGWIVGTAIIAAFHGVVIGTVLFLLGVPLAAPLAVLVFLGSFIPIIGAVLFGGLAVLVTLVAQGPISALVLLAVLLVENQVEAHLLQPFIVGRAVRLHPVAIVVALTGGGLLAGIFGAILAIPIVASVHAAVKYLTGVEDVHGRPRRLDDDRMRPEAPPEYAPLPIYASPLAYPEPASTDGDGRATRDASGTEEERDAEERSHDNPSAADEPHSGGGKPLVEAVEPDPDDE
jgi:predicted PurR-regulated permease PerM